MFSFPINTFADKSLEVNVQYGIQNKIQVGKPIPINIQLTNKSNSTIEGDFVIFSNPTYNMHGSYVLPISIASGETKELDFVIKGLYEHNLNDNLFRFYDGGVKKGKEIKLTGNSRGVPNPLPPERIIAGILSDNTSNLKYFKLMSFHGESMEWLSLDEAEIPTDYNGLKILDLIIVNTFDLQRLSDEQRKALQEWVFDGGTLFYDTYMNISNSLQGIEDLLLLKPSNVIDLHSPKQLPNSLTVFNGKVVGDNVKVMTIENDIPFMLSKPYGNGTVMQFTTSFSNDKVTEWKEASNYFQTALSTSLSTKNMDIKYGYNVEEELAS